MIRDRNNRNRLLELQAPALRGTVRTRCDDEAIGLDMLTKLAERLDERSMEILVARFYDDMKQEEIAKSLDTSRKTVGRVLQRIQHTVTELNMEVEGAQ